MNPMGHTGKTVTLAIKFDSASASQALELFRELSALIEPKAAQKLFDSGDLLSEFFRFETDLVLGRTDECVVRLHPSDRLRDLLAAYRAGQVDGLVIEK
jgi:hypothetical protein